MRQCLNLEVFGREVCQLAKRPPLAHKFWSHLDPEPRRASTNKLTRPLAHKKPERFPGGAMLFQLRDVTKTYGKVTALRQLSVEVPTGAVGLLGPNGAGKTTLIRTLLGLIPIDAGSGQVLGMDIRSRPLDVRQAVRVVPPDDCLFPAVPGIEFAAYAGELCRMASADAMQRAHGVRNYVGLDEARYRRVESYSTGMKQRLKLAAAIVHDPQLLILDEPTNGMAPPGRQEILALPRHRARQK